MLSITAILFIVNISNALAKLSTVDRRSAYLNCFNINDGMRWFAMRIRGNPP